jgi:hypothetical protein
MPAPTDGGTHRCSGTRPGSVASQPGRASTPGTGRCTTTQSASAVGARPASTTACTPACGGVGQAAGSSPVQAVAPWRIASGSVPVIATRWDAIQPASLRLSRCEPPT